MRLINAQIQSDVQIIRGAKKGRVQFMNRLNRWIQLNVQKKW